MPGWPAPEQSGDNRHFNLLWTCILYRSDGQIAW